MAQPGQPVPTVTELLLHRERDHNPGLLFEDQRWTWAQHVRECADRAALLTSLRRPGLRLIPGDTIVRGSTALQGDISGCPRLDGE